MHGFYAYFKTLAFINNNTMKRFFLLAICILCSIYNLEAQEIVGKVTDEKGEYIFFATAALFSTSDSSIVSASSTDENGYFEIRKIKDGNYYLEVSMLSYDPYYLDVTIPNDQPVFLEIRLEPNSEIINTIEVVGKLPLMEQKADKLIVNVEGNVSNTSGSLLDVMKKVPGMLVINDRLQMPGVGSPTILLNGKTTQYMDVQALLRDMPGDNIKKVEIIHQPGAEYDAAGSGPIINIILKKNVLFGTSGSVNAGVGKGELWDYTSGLSLSHYQGSVNINAGLGYAKNAYVEEIILERNLNGIDPQLDGNYFQTNIDKSTPRSYRGNLRIDWDATERHRIGFESRYFNNDNQRIATNETIINLFNDQFTDYDLNTDNDIDRSWNYRSFNPYYIFEIDSAGQKLEFDISYANYQVDALNTLSTTSTLSNNIDRTRYTQPGDTKIFVTALDYVLPLTESVDIKTGVKYSKADLDNNLISEFNRNDEPWMLNVDQSNRYLFDEEIYAAYGKLDWVRGEWSGTAGLRYEFSESVGESVTLDSIQSRDISKLFPSFSLAKKLVGPLSAAVSYSYRIDRPRYSTLNPFVYYLDPFTFEQGNPNLRPELTHSAKFTVTADGQPFFNIEYKKSQDAIVEVTRQETDSQEASKTEINFDDQTQFSTSLFFPMDIIPGLSGGYGGVILNRNSYNSLLQDATFDRTQWNTTAVLQMEFNLPWEINAEIGGWYTSGQQEGIFAAEYLYGSNFGMSKKFLDNKAKISVGVEDFVNKFWVASVDYQQDLKLNVRWQAPVFNMRFSYKFGNQHLKSKKKKSSSARDVLQRASQG